MTDADYGKGFVLMCDQDGIVRKVAVTAVDIANTNLVGESFLRIFDVANIDKALRFLTELRTHGSVFAWEINVAQGDGVSTMRFAGVRQGEDLIIFGAPNDDQIMLLYEEMTRINNEQMTALRVAVKNQVQQGNLHPIHEVDTYDDLMKLNNELMTLQRELARKNRELERLNAQKNQFLGMAAHDLRNPLGVIQAFSEFLLSDLPASVSPQHMEFVQEIQHLSKFMLGMVNDLLDIATIDAGKVNLNLEPVNLADLVAQNLKLNRVLAARKEIELSLTCSPDLPRVWADPGKLQQVLNNLLSNALKFSQPQTRVTVVCTVVGAEVAVAVTDQGPGIPPGEIANLFKAFARTSVKSTAGEKSTGLGLLITKRIVDGHGGRIWVDSEIGRGTTFTFTLPREISPQGEKQPGAVSPVETAPALTPTSCSQASNSSARILIAEDNVLNQKVILHILSSMGYAADVAENGALAVAAVARQPYDLVLMDMYMPEMGGLEANRQIRALPGEHHPHIYALTAGVASDERQSCLDAGMEGFLSKPVQREELVAVLREIGFG